jgi:predicted enzyme related to lactoylglutathione lyase
MPRSSTNGKICYIEIPATDIARSSDFYRAVFGWNIRQRSDGRQAFDDSTGQVSGTWVLGRAPGKQPGLLIYVMADNVQATLRRSLRTAGRSHRRSAQMHPRSPQGLLTRLETSSVFIRNPPESVVVDKGSSSPAGSSQ